MTKHDLESRLAEFGRAVSRGEIALFSDAMSVVPTLSVVQSNHVATYKFRGLVINVPLSVAVRFEKEPSGQRLLKAAALQAAEQFQCTEWSSLHWATMNVRDPWLDDRSVSQDDLRDVVRANYGSTAIPGEEDRMTNEELFELHKMALGPELDRAFCRVTNTEVEISKILDGDDARRVLTVAVESLAKSNPDHWKLQHSHVHVPGLTAGVVHVQPHKHFPAIEIRQDDAPCAEGLHLIREMTIAVILAYELSRRIKDGFSGVGSYDEDSVDITDRWPILFGHRMPMVHSPFFGWMFMLPSLQFHVCVVQQLGKWRPLVIDIGASEPWFPEERYDSERLAAAAAEIYVRKLGLSFDNTDYRKMVRGGSGS